jgi:hypothetical protein
LFLVFFDIIFGSGAWKNCVDNNPRISQRKKQKNKTKITQKNQK